MILKKGKINDEIDLDGIEEAVNRFKLMHHRKPEQIMLTKEYCLNHNIFIPVTFVPGCPLGFAFTIPVYLSALSNYVCYSCFKVFILN